MIAPQAHRGEIPRRANMGGPMTRERRERIRETLLGHDDRSVRCPRVVLLGILFPDDDPVDCMARMLAEEGYASAEALRADFAIPSGRLLARDFGHEACNVDYARSARRDVLWQALMLGLCTARLYDPARPVLWTQASLRRRIELFDPAGFYA